MYRVQRFDKKTVGLHWQRHKTGAAHFEKAKKMGQKLPVAVTWAGIRRRSTRPRRPCRLA
jgi:4-hydroxy-3-polyprenylbenzoate decarboxylase